MVVGAARVPGHSALPELDMARKKEHVGGLASMSQSLVKRGVAFTVAVAMLLPSLPSAVAASPPIAPPKIQYTYAATLGDTQAIGPTYAQRWEKLSDLARQAQGQGSLIKSGTPEAFLREPVDVTRLTAEVLQAGRDLTAIAIDLEQQFDRDEQYLREKRMPAVIFERHAKARMQVRERRESLEDAFARLTYAQRIANYDGQKEALGVVAKLVAAMPSAKSFVPMKTDAIAREGRIGKARAPLMTETDLRASLEGVATKALEKAAPAPPGPADLAAKDEVQLTPKIVAQAAALNNNPVAIFNWVRNSIDFLPTYGSIQGSELTRINQRGNAVDTASLLIATLRAANVPARYVYGTVQMPIATAQNWLGGNIAPNLVVDLMTKGGIPATAVVTGGQVSAVQLEHTWVEAYVDFTPSRGAVNRAASTWVPMDASFKTYSIHAPINLTQGAPFDAQGLANQLNASATHGANGSITGFDVTALGTAIDAYRASAVSYVNQVVPNATMRDVRGYAAIVASNPAILAGTLPYTVVLKGNTYSELPASLHHTLKLTYYASETDYQADSPSLVYSTPLATIGLGTIGVDYVPATQADQTLIAQLRHDNAETLSPYLINVVPQVQVEGTVVNATALSPVSMGTIQYWKTDIVDPHGIYPATSAANRVVAGSHTAFVVDGAGVTTAMVQKRLDLIPAGVSYPVRELLQQAGLNFWMIRDEYDQTWASQFAGKVVRLPSVGGFSTPLQVSYAFGIARSGSFNGFQTDVKRNLYATVNPTQAQQVQMFTFMGNTGSLLEGSVWEFLLGKPFCTAASAARLLAAANDQRIPIYAIDSTNRAAILPTLTIASSDTLQEISNAVLAGKRVIVPQSDLTLGKWRGVGYVIQDPQDGTGVYQIDGGLSGGIVGGCEASAVVDNAAFQSQLAQELERSKTQFANNPQIQSALMAPNATMVPLVAGLAQQLVYDVNFGLVSADFQATIASGVGAGISASEGCSYISCPSCNGGAGAGNPVSLPTGEKSQVDSDYRGAGDDRLTFTRTYISSARIVGGHMGKRWRHNFERAIYVQPPTTGSDSSGLASSSSYSVVADTGVQTQAVLPATPATPTSVIVYRADGSHFQHVLRSGAYKTNGDTPEFLSRQTDGSGNTTGWTYFSATDDTELYDAAGRLVSSTNRKGMTTTLTYDPQGKLQQVRNHFGRTLTFAYNGAGNIDTITDPASGIWHYGYDSLGNLTSVTGPDTVPKVRQYLYEQDPRTSLLTGIIDENSNRFATYVYDYLGRVKEETHAAGANHLTFAYLSDFSAATTDALGTVRAYQFAKYFETLRPTALSQPCTSGCTGSTASATTYDANGFVSSTKDFNSNVTAFSRDARGLELSRTEASGSTEARTITSIYDPQWRVATRVTEPTSSGNRVTSYTLDARGNVRQKSVTVGAETRTWAYDYNALGQMTSVDGPRSDVTDVTSMTYFPNGDLNTVTDAAVNVTTYSNYDGHGRPQSVTDANGTLTSMTYDLRGRLKTTSTAGETTSYDYDGVGNLQKLMLPDGTFLTYGYDAAERLTSITDSLGNSVTYTLDALGNRKQEDTKNPVGTLSRTMTRVFDNLSRVFQMRGAQSQLTQYGYDVQGNLKTLTDPLTHATANDYDALNRLKKVTQPLLAGQSVSGAINYAYDAQDNLSGVADPRGLTTTYAYSGFNELKTLTSADTGITQYTYDPAGNVKTMQDARGQGATYTYDALNRLKTLLYSDESIGYTYDNVAIAANSKGRLSQLSDGSGSTTYAYDARGRVSLKTQLIGSVPLQVHYGYNAAGQLASVTTPSNQLIEYGYLNNQVVSVKVNGGSVLASAKYFPFGGVASWTWGNGSAYQRAYDLDGRIQSVTIANQTRTYGFDDASRITGLTDAQGATTVQAATISYDNLDRLTTALNSASGGYNQTFVYDLLGNRTSETIGGQSTTLTYGLTSNRLTQLGTQAIGYDNAGNTANDGSFTYVYSGRNRLAQVQQGASPLATYKHNALGQRVSKSAGATTLFAYDEAGHLLGEYDSTGAMIQETVWLNDTPVATLRRSGTATVVHYVWADHLDTPRAVTTSDAASTLEWKWDSDPFGTTTAQPIALTYNLRFPGQYFDAETAKHYNYFRDYDPASGRYIESDPIGLQGGIDTFGYVNGNPLSLTDREGKLFSRECGRCIVTYDSDQFKGAHTHWQCPGQPRGCIKKNGELCDGSAPPPKGVEECLKDWGRIPSPKKEMCGSTCQTLVGGLVLGALVVGAVCVAGPVGGAAVGIAGLATQ